MTEPGDEREKTAKPMLTVEEQIAHLKSKGVTFELCSEEEAASHLADETYFFKIAAYRGLFQKRVGGERDGQYINLDFGHLMALASLDRCLRHTLLPLTLDVENAARTKLIRIATKREDENGYTVTHDYMSSLNHNEKNRRKGEIKMLEKDAFCGSLVRRYGDDPSKMPLWVLLELFSFGSLTDLYLFCANRWEDAGMRDEHYLLRQAKSVRNACAHSSAMVNGFATWDASVETNESVQQALAEAGISHRMRTSKMRNGRIKQVTTLLYLHSTYVIEEGEREEAKSSMSKLRTKMKATAEFMPTNDAVKSSTTFLTKIIDSWF